MTWLSDAQKNRPSTEEAEKLKTKRAALVKQIQTMNQSTGMQRSQAGRDGHMEDMKKLAAQIASIDRKLGRT
jgi:hypothetical protein